MRRVAFFPILSLLLIFLLSSCGGGGEGPYPPVAELSSHHHIRRGHIHRRNQRHPEWHGQSQRPSHPGLVRIRHGSRSSGICELSASGCREWIDCPPVSTNLSVLAPGTTYYFRVRAENSAGYSTGQIMNFATASAGSPPAVTTIAATSVGVTGATLNGSVIPNGLATDAWFEWGTDSTLASFSTTGTQAVGSGTTSQAVNQALTGLTTGTRYYYRVAANATGRRSGDRRAPSSSLLSFGVVSTTPPDNATDVPLGSIITVTFNRDVEPATLVGAITVSSLIGNLPGVISYNATTKTATFTPGTPFAPLTVYTVTVDDKVKSGDGVTSRAVYIQLNPQLPPWRGADGDDAHDDGGRDDRCDAQRERESERPGDRRMVRVGNQPEPGHLQHDIHPGAGGRGEFPAGDGDPVGIEFRDDLLLPGGCFQLDGTGEGVDRGFTTASSLSFGVVSTTPANNATDVPLGDPITVTFNQDVEPATLVGAITVSSSAGNLPGVTSYNSTTKTAIFTPGTPFAPLTDYTVTVAAKVKSVTTARLSAPYIFTFKTGSAI